MKWYDAKSVPNTKVNLIGRIKVTKDLIPCIYDSNRECYFVYGTYCKVEIDKYTYMDNLRDYIDE